MSTPTRPTYTATARITLIKPDRKIGDPDLIRHHQATATRQYDGLPKSGWARTEALAGLAGEATLAACKELAETGELAEADAVDVAFEETVAPSLFCTDYPKGE